MSFRGMETSMQDGVFYQIVSSGLKTVCEDEFWEQKDTIAVIWKTASHLDSFAVDAAEGNISAGVG